MARNLTTPITPSDITDQAITRIFFEIPHDGAVMNKSAISVAYEVTTWDSNGDEYNESVLRSISLPNWPTSFKTTVKDMYSLLEVDAENNGLIGAGTSEPLE